MMDGEVQALARQIMYYGGAMQTPIERCALQERDFSQPGKHLREVVALDAPRVWLLPDVDGYIVSAPDAHNRPTLAPTPRNAEDRGFPRSHENGLRVADVLREVPHG